MKLQHCPDCESRIAIDQNKNADLQPLWRFNVECDLIAPNTYEVRIRKQSGKLFVRRGYNPLLELIRIIGHQQRTKK